MRKFRVNKGTETKSEIFQGNIFKSDVVFHWSQNIVVFQRLMKSKSVNFIIKMNTNLENEIRLDIFSWDIFKSEVT